MRRVPAGGHRSALAFGSHLDHSREDSRDEHHSGNEAGHDQMAHLSEQEGEPEEEAIMAGRYSKRTNE